MRFRRNRHLGYGCQNCCYGRHPSCYHHHSLPPSPLGVSFCSQSMLCLTRRSCSLARGRCVHTRYSDRHHRHCHRLRRQRRDHCVPLQIALGVCDYKLVATNFRTRDLYFPPNTVLLCPELSIALGCTSIALGCSSVIYHATYSRLGGTCVRDHHHHLYATHPTTQPPF